MPGRPRSSSTTSGGVAAASRMASSPDAARIDVVAAGGEVEVEGPAKLGLVVHHEDARHAVGTSIGGLPAAPTRRRRWGGR